MCYISTMRKCCSGDFSDAVEAPGDRSVTIGERTIPIRFYQTGIIGENCTIFIINKLFIPGPF